MGDNTTSYETINRELSKINKMMFDDIWVAMSLDYGMCEEICGVLGIRDNLLYRIIDISMQEDVDFQNAETKLGTYDITLEDIKRMSALTSLLCRKFTMETTIEELVAQGLIEDYHAICCGVPPEDIL